MHILAESILCSTFLRVIDICLISSIFLACFTAFLPNSQITSQEQTLSETREFERFVRHTKEKRKMSMNPFPPSAMAPETTNSNNGSPGPSVQYEELSYKIEQRSKFEASANAEIECLRRELHDSRQRIDRDTSVINALHDKVTELEELVKKQKITISTQSKAISDRRVLRKNQQQQQNQQPQSPMGPAMGAGMGMFPMTPSSHHQQQHNVHQSQYLGSGASGASAGSIGASTASVSAGGIVFMQSTSSPFEMQRQAQTPQSVKSFDPTTQFNTVFDQPPPKFEILAGPSYTAYTPAVPSGLAPDLERGTDVFDPMGSITIANMTGPAHSATSLGAANYHKDMANFSTRFLGLMRMAEVFGQTHASLPNVFLDSRLDDHVKDYLMAVSSRTQASILIGNASTRSFFVARAINWYLVEKILKIGIIRGLDAAVDMEIGEMQKQIASDTSIGIRHLMLNAIANHLESLSRRPDFNGFAKKKIHHHATKLWSVIGPLGHDSANQNNMWTDLHAIITEAHCLAIEMYSVPLEYRFELPEHNEPFDPFTMINRDPYIHGDPQILQNGDARVRLAITPTVRIRNNSQSPGEVHLMYLGHVLLKVSRTQ